MKQQNWEKEFDEQFAIYSVSKMGVPHFMGEGVKDFIHKLLAQEEANWMAEIHDQIEDAEKRGDEKGYGRCLDYYGLN